MIDRWKRKCFKQQREKDTAVLQPVLSATVVQITIDEFRKKNIQMKSNVKKKKEEERVQVHDTVRYITL